MSALTAARESGRHLREEALELPALIPGRETQRDVPEARVRVGAQLGHALGGWPRDRPPLDEARRELARIVGGEEGLALGEGGGAILVDVDVVVERAAEPDG